jgi:hypothetical protein
MFDENTIVQQFKMKVCEEITLTQKGVGRFVVNTPFMFEDGDHFVIILKYDSDLKSWYLTDEGHTFMHLSYFMDERDLDRGTRKDIIDNCKKMFSIGERNGELFINIEKEEFGDALYNFVQCLMKINDVTYLERERIKTTFFEDFRKAFTIVSKTMKAKVQFDYYVGQDKKRHNRIDGCILTEKKPVYVFAINNSDRCRDAIITILMLEKWNLKFHSVGVFEDFDNIQKNVLGRFTDVCEKQITDLSQIERVEKFIKGLGK